MPSFSRYRVYPPSTAECYYIQERPRARSFRHLKAAMEYAAECYTAQGMSPTTPVDVVTGSGSDYKRIGVYGPNGWRWADSETLPTVEYGPDCN